MKILIIRPTDAISGAETYNLFLLKRLKLFPDLDISFLTNYEPFSGELEKLGIKTYFFNPRVKEVGTKKDLLKAVFLAPLFVIGYINAIKKSEKGSKYGILLLESMTEKLFLSPILKLMGYKVLWLEHGPLFITNRTELIKKAYKVLSGSVDKIIAVSEDTKQDLLKGGVSLDKLTTIPTGIDTEKFKRNEGKESLEKQLGIDSKFVIGYSGNIVKEKGVEIFIEVARKVLEKNKQVNFLLVGNGELTEWAKIRVKELGLENYFFFTGFQKDVKPYLNMMDIFFFPTLHHEGLSMALLEAGAMEVLPVSHDIGGNREIVINRKTGFLYTDSDPRKIADILTQVIKHYAGYKLLRKNARQLVVEKFNVHKMAKQYHELFRNL